MNATYHKEGVECLLVIVSSILEKHLQNHNKRNNLLLSRIIFRNDSILAITVFKSTNHNVINK
jgi:hypothetical protein